MGSLVLRVLAWLVPADRRARWLREWEAEWSARGRAGDLIPALEDAAALRLRSIREGRTGMGMDVRFALRGLRRNPVFAGVVVLTLALGIGANVAIFSVVRAVLLRPFPFEDPEELATVTLAFERHGDPMAFPASVPEYFELRAENPAFEELAGFWESEMNLGGVDEPVRVTSLAATAELFDVLGVDARLGRTFAPDEDLPGADRVAVLAHGAWERFFGARRDVVGETVLLDETPYTVIGVMPEAFAFPGSEIDVVRNLVLDPADPGSRSSHWLYMLARLADGTDLEAARRTTDGLVARWSAEYPGRHGPGEGHPVLVGGLRDAVAGDVRTPLMLLFGAVGLVLLVACVNVANLMLVRGEDRRVELGVRTALGAGQGALLRQLLVEASVLALAGGLLGVALAHAGVAVLPALAGGTLPAGTRVEIDGPVLAFGAAATLASALLFGLLPALVTARSDVADVVRDGGDRAGTGRRRVAFRRLLVTVEVSLAVALLAGAGVLSRGLVELMAVDPGFDPSGVVTLDVELTPGTYPEPSDVSAFHRELSRRLTALPAVEVASAVRSLPLRAGGGWETLELMGHAPVDEDEVMSRTVQYQVVDPGFFAALGIPVLRGRTFTDADDAGSLPVTVMNEAAVRELYGEADALGERVRHGVFPDNPNPVFTVVGVVGSVRQAGLDRAPPAQMYVTRAQAGAVYGGLGTRLATLVLRTRGRPEAVVPAVRGVIAELDADLPVANVRTMEEQVRRSVGDRRFLALLMGLFSVLALVLGSVGLYGLMSYVVSKRRREIGIRLALGAAAGRVRRGVVGEAMALVLVGSVVGVGAALLGADLLEGLVFGVDSRDPVALVGAPVLLAAVAFLAAWLPARRASGVDPAEALRRE